MATAPKITSTPGVVHLTKYPEIVNHYFVKQEDSAGNITITEVYKVNKSTKPVDGARVFDVITSTGKTHVFATEVKEEVVLKKADKLRMIAELKAKFEAGTIDHQAYADAITPLI